MQQLRRKTPQLHWIWSLCAFLFLLNFPAIEKAGAADLEADTVKAAFVLNFARYTIWPNDTFTSPTAPIELWVFGSETTRRAFDTIHKKSIGSREIHVRHVKSPQLAQNCHMMFISQDVDRSILSGALATAQKRPVLTIGERPDFIRIGGTINIFSKNGRFYFEINPKTAHRHAIKLSSRLLKLAIITGDS